MSFYFWKSWKYFSKFSPVKENAPDQHPVEGNNPKAKYEWMRWGYIALEENLEPLLFGMEIDESWEPSDKNNRRFNIQSKWIQELDELSETQKTKIMEELEWSIWLKLIDMSANLQWLKWKHLFWFYCLIKWLEAKSNCPYWNCEVTIDTLGTNTNLVSTFNLMIRSEKEKDSILKLHKQKWDLNLNGWNREIWDKCILPNELTQDDLDSLRIFIKHTYYDWGNLSMPDNSIKLFVENQIEHIEYNKDILNKIIHQWFEKHYQKFNELLKTYTFKIKRIHSLSINQLFRNIKISEQIQNKINKIAESEKISNLNDLVMTIKGRKDIEKDTFNIVKDYEHSCFNQEVPFIDPPIKKLFEINSKYFKNEWRITMKLKIQDLKINEIFLEKVNLYAWDVYIKTDDIQDWEWFLLANIKKEDFISVDNQFEPSKLQQNGKLYLVNKIVFNGHKMKPNDKITIELKFWQITDQLNSYIKKCEDSVTKNLQRIFN